MRCANCHELLATGSAADAAAGTAGPEAARPLVGGKRDVGLDRSQTTVNSAVDSSRHETVVHGGDTNVVTTHHGSGLSAWGLVGVLLVVGASMIGLAYLLRPASPAPGSAAVPHAASLPADEESKPQNAAASAVSPEAVSSEDSLASSEPAASEETPPASIASLAEGGQVSMPRTAGREQPVETARAPAARPPEPSGTPRAEPALRPEPEPEVRRAAAADQASATSRVAAAESAPVRTIPEPTPEPPPPPVYVRGSSTGRVDLAVVVVSEGRSDRVRAQQLGRSLGSVGWTTSAGLVSPAFVRDGLHRRAWSGDADAVSSIGLAPHAGGLLLVDAESHAQQRSRLGTAYLTVDLTAEGQLFDSATGELLSALDLSVSGTGMTERDAEKQAWQRLADRLAEELPR